MNFDRDELKQAVKDLAFDAHHFRCYVRLHREGRLSTCSPAVAQAVRYSLLLHMRVLLNFFSGPPKQDDCWVGHFTIFSGVEKEFNLGVLTPTDDARMVGMNLNKRLAHFTATRWREQAPAMDFYESFFIGIENLIDRFQASLPDDVREVFTNQLGRWEVDHPGANSRVSRQCEL